MASLNPNLPPVDTPPRLEEVVFTASTYADTQRAVDTLSDAGFPVEHVRIVGTDMRLVEQVTGRMTVWGAAGSGAATGAWFGLFVGLLFGLFALPGEGWFTLLLVAVAIGAFWGALFGFAAHSATRGARDFASTSRLEAGLYEVTVASDHAAEARRILDARAAPPA